MAGVRKNRKEGGGRMSWEMKFEWKSGLSEKTPQQTRDEPNNTTARNDRNITIGLTTISSFDAPQHALSSAQLQKPVLTLSVAAAHFLKELGLLVWWCQYHQILTNNLSPKNYMKEYAFIEASKVNS